MDSKRKEEISAFYERLHTLLHKKKVERKVVKRLLYDDKETHKKLNLTEGVLNTMWSRLCKDKEKPPRIQQSIVIGNTSFEVIKLEKSKKPKQANKGGGKVATQVIQYNPETNKEVRRFKSAVACAQELGLKIGTVRNILYGITNNPKAHIRYAESSEQKAENSEQKAEISEQKPKRKYTKKVTIATVVSKDQELEVAKKIEEVKKTIGFTGEGKAELKNVIAEVLKPSTVNAELPDELPDGYEELNETPLEKKDEQNPFEVAPDPEQKPILVEELKSLKFEPLEPRINIDTDVKIQQTSADKTVLEVIRRAYIQELKNHINDEVKKLTSEIIAEETKLFIEGTKTI